MKILTTNIFIVVLCIWNLSACKENEQRNADATKHVERTSNIPKDTLIQMIQVLSDYTASRQPNDTGFAKIIQSFQQRYIIGFNTNIVDDTISDIHIGGSFNHKENAIIIFPSNTDSTKWLTFTDLTKAFGKYEEGEFDNKIPLPKEPGYKGIYTIQTKSGIPVFLLANAVYLSQNEFLIKTLELKKEKQFHSLKNK